MLEMVAKKITKSKGEARLADIKEKVFKRIAPILKLTWKKFMFHLFPNVS